MTVKSLLPQALFGLLFLPLGSSTANAQYNSYGYSFSNPVTAQLNTNYMTGMNSRLIYRMILKKHGYTDVQLTAMKTEQMYDLIQRGDYGDKSAKPSPRGVAQTTVPDRPASRFKPTAKRLLLPDMVKSMTDKADYQTALLEVFETGIREFEKEASKHDLVNDVAGATAYFIGCAYSVCRDGEEPSTDGLVLLARALQLQFNTDEFRRIPDGDKQKFYELMAALGTYLVASRQTAEEQKDAEFRATIKKAAADALKGYLKMDPAKFKITANGVEIVSGAAVKDPPDIGSTRDAPRPGDASSLGVLSVPTPKGWHRSERDGLIILEREIDLGFGQKNLFRLIFASPVRARESALATFQTLWKEFAGATFDTPIRPLPLRVRLKNGATLLYDGAEMRLKQTKAKMLGFIYVVVRGNTAVPVIGVFSGGEQNLDQSLREAFDGVRLTGASGGEPPLFDRKELTGRWRASTTSLANWVDAAGNYRGDASVAMGETLSLNADGTFRSQFAALGTGRTLRSDTAGPFTIDDDTLVLQAAGEKASRFRITGAGRSADGKAHFLLLGVTRNDFPALSAGSGMPRAGDAYVAVGE